MTPVAENQHERIANHTTLKPLADSSSEAAAQLQHEAAMLAAGPDTISPKFIRIDADGLVFEKPEGILLRDLMDQLKDRQQFLDLVRSAIGLGVTFEVAVVAVDLAIQQRGQSHQAIYLHPR